VEWTDVHAHVFGRPAGADAFGQIVAMVVADDTVWTPTKSQLVGWWLDQT
jgi:hypothetical protein